MKRCESVNPDTGEQCSLEEGHAETGPIKAHMNEGVEIAGGIHGAQGMMYKVWHEEKEDE